MLRVELVVVNGGREINPPTFDISVVLIQGRDTGIYNAMNIGMDSCHGEYLWFLNSGDYLNSRFDLNYLKKSIRNGYDYFFYGWIDDYGSFRGERKAKSSNRIANGMICSHQSFFVKRSFVNENNIKYVERFSVAADYLFIWDIIELSGFGERMSGAVSICDKFGFSNKNKYVGRNEQFGIRIMKNRSIWFCLFILVKQELVHWAYKIPWIERIAAKVKSYAFWY